MIRVAIVDDHELVRQGIKALLEREHDMEIVGEAGEGVSALTMVRRELPDVVVMDIVLPGASGLEVAAELRAEGDGPAVVVLTMHSDESLIRRALDEGVRGFVLKESIVDELILAIRAANRGGTYIGPNATTSADPISAQSGYEALTDRERQILYFISEGLTNQNMASRLSISVKTVERHRQSIMRKMDAHNVVELLRAAIRLGYISLDS